MRENGEIVATLKEILKKQNLQNVLIYCIFFLVFFPLGEGLGQSLVRVDFAFCHSMCTKPVMDRQAGVGSQVH